MIWTSHTLPNECLRCHIRQQDLKLFTGTHYQMWRGTWRIAIQNIIAFITFRIDNTIRDDFTENTNFMLGKIIIPLQ